MEKSFFDVINERFSCRSFKDKQISNDELNIVLEAGRCAPTACNFQPHRIFVVQKEEILQKLRDATRFTFDAKTILVVCYDTSKSWHRRSDEKDHGEIDATIVATHMVLAATAINLGTCYVCAFKKDIVRQILDIPSEYEISCLLPIGYPSVINNPNTRLDLEDTVIYK
ncbi:MAG: nitroreductase family protein [Acholeplasmatales bacterium]|nr:nitroreductase family protein [Acholeplasmatales bacterium]